MIQESFFGEATPDNAPKGARCMIQESFFGEATPAGRPHEYPIPPVATIVSCRSCGAAIVWTHTPTGRAVPLALSTVQTRDGAQYAVSHFRDCPDAWDWGRG